MTDIVGIIPARGGSKGLHKKNIRELDGTPLIAYTIEAAKNSEILDDFYVSTDSIEIKKKSEEHGAEVIDRPPELAEDDSKSIEAIIHALESIEKNYEIVVTLQPTSPFRNGEHIDEAIEKFLNHEKASSLISVAKTDHPPQWSYSSENEYLEPLFGSEYLEKRRQNLEIAYMPNGAIFINDVDNLLENKELHSDKAIKFEMSQKESVDIDEPFDLKIAEKLTEGEEK